jgi:hypothetical protein
MAEDPDSERLLAEALRAQASRTPLAPSSGATGSAGAYQPGPAAPFELLSGTDPGYGLLSGREPEQPTNYVAGYPATQNVHGYPDARTGPLGTTVVTSGPEPIRAWWVLLLALLLGLAAGAVVGLFTLI